MVYFYGQGGLVSRDNCRECPIRDRCIEQGALSDSIKNMIRNAFAAHTDTISTWATLQKSCLWVKEEEERKRRALQTSLLQRRLREARQAQEQPDALSTEETIEPDGDVQEAPTGTVPPPEITQTFTIPPDSASMASPGPTQVEVMFSEEPHARVFDTDSEKPFQSKQKFSPKPAELRWLVVNGSHRHISLPISGAVVLGRFSLRADSPLDVDLTYENRDRRTVSRRHARIIGDHGHHTIEDLGSTNGIFINGMRVTPDSACQLQDGSYVALGNLQMVYDKVPADFLNTFPIEATHVRRFLFFACSGRRVRITPPNNLLIGRSDPAVGFVPSVDLRKEGKVATHVSRRHARITWSIHGPCLKVLNGTYGTRLNGEVLSPDQSVLLKPGDHISLGGCVLAYDVEV